MTLTLFRGECPAQLVADELDANHYLGRRAHGWAWSDDRGVLVFCPPASRNLPKEWLELSRWCLRGGKNSGSKQWAEVRRHILKTRPEVSTVVSYSDPAAGHDGALYRACGWVWAPVWHRIAPPPTGSGTWNGEDYQTAKDRWVACLRPDPNRAGVLTIKPKQQYLLDRWPFLRWREPRSRRGVCIPNTGGADFKRWRDRES